jgi:hypothetical protein
MALARWRSRCSVNPTRLVHIHGTAMRCGRANSWRDQPNTHYELSTHFAAKIVADNLQALTTAAATTQFPVEPTCRVNRGYDHTVLKPLL